MAQQHRVDGADFLDGHRRRHDLGEQVAGAFALFRSVRVEARIGQQAKSADFDQKRCAAEVGDWGFIGFSPGMGWFGMKGRRMGDVPFSV